MSHFYGTVNGMTQKTQASRRGFKKRGLTTTAASWEGAIEVLLRYDPTTDQDIAEVRMVPWHGNGSSRLLYEGPVGG